MPGAARLVAVEGLEDEGGLLLGDAAAVVLDGELDRVGKHGLADHAHLALLGPG